MPSRPIKRAKLTEPRIPKESAQNGADKHATFTKWAQDRGVETNGVGPARLPGRGLGLVTSHAITKGERMLFVPEKAMFKPNAKFLKAHALERISPHAQLAISLMAVANSDEAPLASWQVTWPNAEDFHQTLPFRWTKVQRNRLPPSVQQPLERQEEDYRKDWNAISNCCTEHDWLESDFLYSWMIVNSRSFHWKPPRGRPGSMVMCPFIDYMNHGPSGTTCNVFQGPQGYEVLADRDYEAGEEVLATYGSHSNDKLLVHYGFVCDSSADTPNIDDDIRLDHVLLPKLSDNIRSQLQDVGFLGAYALLPATNELCFKTQVAVRAVLLTCNEWEYYMSNGEDLSSDYTAAVKEFMRPLLQEYHANAMGHIKWLHSKRPDGHLEAAAGLLMTRWKQIAEALEAYLE
ncbi:hypothetical protein LTR36_005506 [Oleoguttula mirabilis]|uniref:SET domain-containing protein n=1 Tax=Oleoguttula mirabilis TaxID=1507867 RepID=A0AAV9JEA6_9PEZI|nr:hypothetical protein LTR36_005506 [Oleoguttula mirabilis]